jgi:hypothetical protein
MYKISSELRGYCEIPDITAEDQVLIPKRAVMSSTTEAIPIERKISHGIGGAGNVRMSPGLATCFYFIPSSDLPI